MNKVVFITGASRGIGFELARVLLEKGAKVSVCARDQDKLDFAYNQLTQISKNLFSLSVDLSSPQEVERFFKASMAYFGTVDILINNAGVGLFEEVEKSDEKDITKIFSINFFSPISLIKHCLPVFRKKSRGHIVNISSIISTHALYNQGYYAASKAALNRITESIDAECKKDNIHTTLVLPDRTKSHFREHVLGPKENAVLPGNSLREADPRKVAIGIVQAIEENKSYHYTSFRAFIFAILSVICPRIIRIFLGKS